MRFSEDDQPRHYLSQGAKSSLLRTTTFLGIALLLSACTLSARRLDDLSNSTAVIATPVSGNGTISISGPSSLTVNTCSSAYTAQAYNGLGILAPVSVTTLVSFSTASLYGSAAIYSDSACTVPIASVTIPSGSELAQFYLKDSYDESLFITGYASGLSSIGVSTQVTAQPPTQLAVTGPVQFSTGSCSTAFTVLTEDVSGNISPVTAPTTVHLVSGGSAVFYTDPGCGSPTSTLSIASGVPSVTFYMKDLVIESLLVTAGATGLASAEIPVSTLAGTPVKLVLSGPSAPTTGACSTYNIISEDAYNNPSAVSVVTSIAIAGKGLGTFYNNATCSASVSSVSLAVGANSGTFYFKDNTVESDLFTATATGLTSATYPITTQAGAALKLLVSGPLAIAQSGCAGPYTVVSQDTNNNASNVSPAVQVNLTSSGASVFHALSNCSDSAQSSVTIGSGTSSKTFYVLDATAQTMTVTGTDNAGLLTASTTGSIIVSATALVITGPSNPITAATCTGPYTVTNTNGAGAATTVGAATPVTLTKTGSTAAFYATSACSPAVTSVSIPMSSSSQTFYIKDATSEDVTLTATATSIASGTFAVIVGTPAPTKLVVTGPSAPTAGACSGPYTVTSQNVNSTVSPVTALTAVALAGSGSGTFYSDACVTTATSINIAASSSSQTFYFKDTLKESLTLQASATGLTQGTENISIAASIATQLVLTGPNEVAQSICSNAFTATSLDTYRNPANVGSSLTINLTGAAAGTFYSDSSCTTPATSVTLTSGASAISFYFLDTVSQSMTLTVTDGTSSLGSATENIVVSPPPILVAASGNGTNPGAGGNACAVVSGTVWCTGTTLGYGFLGSAVRDSSTFVQIQGLPSGVSSIAMGIRSACIIASGNVWCWGDNSASQLGNNSSVAYSSTPVQVVGLPTGGATVISEASAQNVNPDHVCAVANSAAYCWGSNTVGALGNNSTANSAVPVQVQGLSSGVTAIAAGDGFTCAVVSGGAWCWGYNNYGQLGDGTTTTRYVPVQVSGLTSGVVSLAAGTNHTCAILNTGAVECWGYNLYGSLGNGATTNSSVPVAVTGISSGATAIALGYNFSCAIVTGGMQCWGEGSYGTLGNNSNALTNTLPVVPQGMSSGVTAIAASLSATFAVASGAIQSWGLDQWGVLGHGILLESSTPLVSGGISSGATAISTGAGYQTCAVVSGGVQCWGWEYSNQGAVGVTGNFPLTAQQAIASGSGATAVSAGGAPSVAFSCAVVSGGVQCWGDDSFGELGNNSTAISITPTQVSGLPSSSGATQISASPNGFACAVVNSGVQCWGNNANGQLGDGTTLTRFSPVQVSGLPSGSGVTAVSTGYYHACALLSSGSVECWGSNSMGQLGNNSTTASYSATAVQGLSTTATAIGTSDTSTCATLTNGTIQCWGSNSEGQLGNNTTTQSLIPVTVQGITSGATAIAGGLNTFCAIVNGGVQCWGDNRYYELGVNNVVTSLVPVQVSGLPSGSSVTSISVSRTFTSCAVVAGAAECWGNNEGRQLGVGTPWFSYVPGNVVPF